jgi:hypothetical protein
MKPKTKAKVIWLHKTVDTRDWWDACNPKEHAEGYCGRRKLYCFRQVLSK